MRKRIHADNAARQKAYRERVHTIQRAELLERIAPYIKWGTDLKARFAGYSLHRLRKEANRLEEIAAARRYMGGYRNAFSSQYIDDRPAL